MTTADDLDFYSLPAPPIGSTIRVYLSHLPADYDLAVYAPTDAQARPEVAGTEPLDSPPLGDEGVPIDTRRAALPPETLDDLRLEQDRPLVGVSANRATEDDSVVAISGGGSGNYLIQVTPYNGATSAEPYMLRVEIEPPRVPLTSAALAGATGATGGDPGPARPGTNTLFLWNRSQLNALYGATAATSVLNAMTATQAELTSLGFPSAIVGVDANAGVSGRDGRLERRSGQPSEGERGRPGDQRVVDGLRAQPNGAGIKYLVLVGGDRAIPFARLEDYTTIANEAGYAQSLGTGNELTAALGAGTMLSDDAYADTTPVQYLNRQLFVPNLAVGRLVETPSQIVAALTRYRDFDGRLDPTTAESPATTSSATGRRRCATSSTHATGVTVPAGEDADQRHLDAAEPARSCSSDATEHGVAQRPRRPLPAPAAFAATATTRPAPLTTTELTAAGTPGAAEPARLQHGLPRRPQRRRRARHAAGARLAAGVLGQGRDVPRQHDVRLRRLRSSSRTRRSSTGSSPTQVRAGGPIGDALRLAKQEYFSTRGVFGVYDEKAMAAFTLYGLPMWSIGAAPQPQSTDARRRPAARGVGCGSRRSRSPRRRPGSIR